MAVDVVEMVCVDADGVELVRVDVVRVDVVRVDVVRVEVVRVEVVRMNVEGVGMARVDVDVDGEDLVIGRKNDAMDDAYGDGDGDGVLPVFGRLAEDPEVRSL